MPGAVARALTAPRRTSLSQALDAFEWRHVGPFRGGRVVAVGGDPVEDHVFFFGSTGGGVWRTDDAGSYWENVSDGHFGRASVGAIEVAPADRNVVYVGMGETCIRSTVSHGDGVYGSTDGGATWRHLGLADSRHIGKVRTDPRDPETVFVAALGHASGPNRERGLYRSRDGGRSWRKVLDRGPRAGAVDVALDRGNPRIVYAATWQALREPWLVSSGGPGSGLFRSSDGGDTWTDIARAPGFPSGMLGRIGVAASPARSGRVWAIVEAEAGGLYRSDDGGDSWMRCSTDQNLWYRSYYYQHVVADPRDPDTVWVLNTDCLRSIDGGATFERVATPHGDNHDLWIDPRDPRRMIVGCDGGAAVTFNGAASWSTIHNQATAELYHVATDSREPYHLYASQQDCGTVAMPSRSMIGTITAGEYRDVGGGESGYIAVRQDDPDVVFAGQFNGYLTRYDARTGQARNIEVWPAAQAWGSGGHTVRHRFTWSHPVVLSPHDPGTLYTAAERVFRSTDEGTSWTAISPELTRHDERRMEPSGGAIRRDRPSTERERVCTIFTFAESPLRPGVLWAGTDDGLVHVSRDGGKSWTNVTPRGVPPWTLISCVEPSPHDARVAYVAATRYLLDDFRPMLFRTTDFGRTWRRVASGIGADDFTRVIRADPIRSGLLFAGTETGAYASFDDGATWHAFRSTLPVTPVHDLQIKDGDLIAATHGRGFWIVDDIAALRQSFPAALASRAPRLFAPARATRYQGGGRYLKPPLRGHNYRIEGATTVTWSALSRPGERAERFFGSARNPPDGAVIRYRLGRAATRLTLTFSDAAGRTVRSFTWRDGAPEPNPPRAEGLGRFVWDLRHEGAVELEGPSGSRRPDRPPVGPFVAPGVYRVRLDADGTRRTAEFEVRGDPRTGASPSDIQAQVELLLRLRDATSEAHRIVNAMRRLRRALDEVGKVRSGGRAAPLRALRRRIDAIESEIVQPPSVNVTVGVLMDAPRLAAHLTGLAGKVGNADGRPTLAAEQLAATLMKHVAALAKRAAAAEAAAERHLGVRADH